MLLTLFGFSHLTGNQKEKESLAWGKGALTVFSKCDLALLYLHWEIKMSQKWHRLFVFHHKPKATMHISCSQTCPFKFTGNTSFHLFPNQRLYWQSTSDIQCICIQAAGHCLFLSVVLFAVIFVFPVAFCDMRIYFTSYYVLNVCCQINSDNYKLVSQFVLQPKEMQGLLWEERLYKCPVFLNRSVYHTGMKKDFYWSEHSYFVCIISYYFVKWILIVRGRPLILIIMVWIRFSSVQRPAVSQTMSYMPS